MWNFSLLILIWTTKLDWYLLFIYDTNTPINTDWLSLNQVVRNVFQFIQDKSQSDGLNICFTLATNTQATSLPNHTDLAYLLINND